MSIGPARPPILLHLPKTGGTSVRSAIERAVGPSLVLRVYPGNPGPGTVELGDVAGRLKDEPGTRLIAGHLPFGVHRDLQLPRRYLTVLRHPDAQLVSEAEHYRRASGDRRPVQELLERPSKRFDNPQTRWLLRRSPPAGLLTEQHALTAERNLRSCMAVGTTERLADTVGLFARMLDVPLGAPRRENARPSDVVDGGPAVEVPEARKRWDLHLHRVANELLTAALTQCP